MQNLTWLNKEIYKMAKIGLGQANTLRSNNTSNTGYGIAYADEIMGHKYVTSLTELYNLHDWQLSSTGSAEGGVGQLWFVLNSDKASGKFYQLVNWTNRHNLSSNGTDTCGWKEFNVDYTLDQETLEKVQNRLTTLSNETGCLRFDEYVIGSYLENSTTSLADNKIYYVQTMGTSSSPAKGAFCRKDTDGVYHTNGDMIDYNDFSGGSVRPKANTLFIDANCDLYITEAGQNTITKLSISEDTIKNIFE